LLRCWRANALRNPGGHPYKASYFSASPHVCSSVCQFISQSDTFLCERSGNVHLCGQGRCTDAVEILSGWCCPLTDNRWTMSISIDPFGVSSWGHESFLTSRTRIISPSITIRGTYQRISNPLKKRHRASQTLGADSIQSGKHGDSTDQYLTGISFDGAGWGRKKTLRLDSRFAAKSADTASAFQDVLCRVACSLLAPSDLTGHVRDHSSVLLGENRSTSSVLQSVHKSNLPHVGQVHLKTSSSRVVRRIRNATTRRKAAEAQHASTPSSRLPTHRLCTSDLYLKRTALAVLDALMSDPGGTAHTQADLVCRKQAVDNCLHLWTEFHRVCFQVTASDLVYDFRCHCYVAFNAMCYSNQYSSFTGQTLTLRVHLLRKNDWLAARMNYEIEASSLGLRKGTLKECRRLFGIFMKHLARIENSKRSHSILI
jgi:hypothetical protein